MKKINFSFWVILALFVAACSSEDAKPTKPVLIEKSESTMTVITGNGEATEVETHVFTFDSKFNVIKLDNKIVYTYTNGSEPDVNEGSAEYAYNSSGYLIEAPGRTYEYVSGRLSKMIYGGTFETTYTYNSAGQLTKEEDDNGVKTLYEYTNGNPTKRTYEYPNGTSSEVSFEFNTDGLISKSIQGLYESYYEYDAEDMLIEIETFYDGIKDSRVVYEYDDANRAPVIESVVNSAKGMPDPLRGLNGKSLHNLTSRTEYEMVEGAEVIDDMEVYIYEYNSKNYPVSVDDGRAVTVYTYID